jgi:rubrerythrin
MDKNVKKIKTAIKDEKDDIKEYRHSAKKADPKTAKLFRHIAKEEVGHRNELRKRLAKIKKDK